MPILDPWFYAVAIPAVLIVAISKGGFGGGVAVLGVPLTALAVPVPQAAAIMLPILCLMDVFGVWAYRRDWDRRNMAIMIPGALAGIALGAATFRWFDESMIRLLVGTIAIVFTLSRWRNRGTASPSGPHPLRGTLWSALAGFTSFLAHSGGPAANAYLLPQRMDKTRFVGTMLVFFTTINYLKLAPYAWLGQFPLDNLATSLVLAPLAPLGVWLGIRLHRAIPPLLFYRLCYAFLFVVGWKLVYDGARGLLG